MLTPEYFRGRVELLGASMKEQEEKIAASQKRIAEEQAAIRQAQVAHHTLFGAKQEAARCIEALEQQAFLSRGGKPMAAAQASLSMDAEVTHAHRNESDDRP